MIGSNSVRTVQKLRRILLAVKAKKWFAMAVAPSMAGAAINAAMTSTAGEALIDYFSSKIDFCWKEENCLLPKELFNHKTRRINL
jgi:hypothetical protein